MDLTKHIAFWRMGAAEDFDVAIRLIAENRIRHGLFFLHLAVEKELKALYVEQQTAPAPRTHNLVRLAHDAGVALEPDLVSVLAEVNLYCLEGRYPDCWADPPNEVAAKRLLEGVKEVQKCLRRNC